MVTYFAEAIRTFYWLNNGRMKSMEQEKKRKLNRRKINCLKIICKEIIILVTLVWFGDQTSIYMEI